MRFNIKADNYNDYQKKIRDAATRLYREGMINAEQLAEIINNDLELPHIANDKYEYYSIDTAPGFCAEQIAKVIKLDIEKENRKRTRRLKCPDCGYSPCQCFEFPTTPERIANIAAKSIRNHIWDSLFGRG